MAFSLKDPATSPARPAPAPAAYDYPSLAQIGQKVRRVVLSWWSLSVLVVALLGVALAYQARPVMELELGGGFDAPYLNLSEGGFGRPVQSAVMTSPNDEENTGRAQPVPATTTSEKPTAPEELPGSYRWTRDRPILLWPGVGATSFQLSLKAVGSPLIAAGQQVDLLVNGQPFGQFDLKPGQVSQPSFAIPAERLKGGSLAVEMRVKPLGPVNQKLIEQYAGTYYKIDTNLYQGATGFKFYTARLESQPGAGGLVIPPLSGWLALSVGLWLFYFGLAYVGLPVRWAALGAGLALLGVLVVLATVRLGLTAFSGRLALLLIVAAVILPVLDWIGPRVFGRAGLRPAAWVWQGLLIMFLIGLLGRGGGVLYPQTEVIDAPAHLKEVNTILHAPNGWLNEWTDHTLSKVPDQWQSQAIIPYSTVVYYYFAPVAALPLDPYISVNLFNALLDALRVFVIFGLAVALGASSRAALVAAGLYLIAPSTWLLNSWGNWPTTLSFWLATVFLWLVLAAWTRLDRRAVWITASVILLLTMLAYTVTAVFMGIMLYVWAVGLVFFVRRDPLARRNGLIIAAITTATALIAIAIYYVQFIPDLTTTLTSFDQSLNSKGSLGGFGDRTFGYYLGLYADHLTFRYTAMATILAGLVVWLWTIFTKRPAPPDSDSDEGRLRSGSRLWLGGAWWSVFVLFSLAQWKVDMVDKQIWFVLPLAVSLAGIGIVWVWQTFKTPLLLWGSRAVVTGLVLWTTYSASSLWLERVFIKRR